MKKLTLLGIAVFVNHYSVTAQFVSWDDINPPSGGDDGGFTLILVGAFLIFLIYNRIRFRNKK